MTYVEAREKGLCFDCGDPVFRNQNSKIVGAQLPQLAMNLPFPKFRCIITQ